MSDPRFPEQGENLQSRAFREETDPEAVHESERDGGFGSGFDGEEEPRAEAVVEAADGPVRGTEAHGTETDETEAHGTEAHETEADENDVDDVDRDVLVAGAADVPVSGVDEDDDSAAFGSRAVREAPGMPAVTGHGGSGDSGDSGADRFFQDSVSEKLRDRWQSIQIDFVDDPRHAVEQAEELVEQVSTQLTESIAARRRELRSSWSKDGAAASAAHDNGVATEDLRTALQDYRRVFQQLLAL